MTTDTAVSLAGQRRALREQLKAQRRALARELAAADDIGDGYPRSVTMRWLIREPELVGKLVGQIAGARTAAALPVVLLLVRLLHSTLVVRSVRQRTDPPRGRAYLR